MSSTPEAPTSIQRLSSEYYPRPDVFDEMMVVGGRIREHWMPLAREIDRLGAEGLCERRELARHLLSEHGVTYNVNGEGRQSARNWELDLLPLVISAEEWSTLEAGLIQRTRLMNLVLADIYGPQRLLRDGLLPPALLQANPGFLRSCHGVKPPRGLFLTLHAIDLTRAPDGKWWVLSERTQAPSGVGYALENRIILSRVLPEGFAEGNVQRLASFFAERREGLRSLAPWTDSPHIVLLTSGPYTETYFEHTYLARYLGFPLVEGSDLTVRDQRVFLKTLEGLQQVDVIVRRVDDTFCDPLELRADSILGVPGLVQAALAGNVAISNALGAGAVEAPALLAFLPALAQRLLGEDLRIPNVATWWCGQEKERAHTLANLKSLVVKRGFVGHAEPRFGESLSADELAALKRRIESNPHAYVGQEQVALSTAPAWNGWRLEQRPLIMRCYVCATKDGFAVMPGGLTRLSRSATSPIVSSHHGGGSKDTWVLASAPVPLVTLLDSAGQPAGIERGPAQVPSRVVENLFWLGRYAERLEDTTRLLRTALSRLSGEAGQAEDAELAAIARWLVWNRKLPTRFAKRVTYAEFSAALRDLVFLHETPGSLRELLDRIAFLTASVRDRFSGDTWRILNHLQTEFPRETERTTPGALVVVLHRIVFQLAAFSGMEMENMTRGHAWRFLEIGRRLERAINVAASIRAVVATDESLSTALLPLLEYTDSTMTYRRRYLARPELPATLALLLSDESNPRSLAFQLRTLDQHLRDLPSTNGARLELKKFEELAELLENEDVRALGAMAKRGDPQPLAAFLDEVTQTGYGLSDLLSAAYFSHVPARAN